MLKICQHQLLLSLSSPRTYIALFVGCVAQIISATPLLEFSEAIEKPLCIMDGFIYFNCDTYLAATAFVGTLLLVSDIPFSSESELYTLIRVSRVRWMLGKMLYLLCVCILYYLAIMAVGMVFISGNAYAANFWSEPIYMLAKGTSGIAETFNVSFSHSAILLLTPIEAVSWSFLLSVTYSFLMSLFFFLFNLWLSRVLSYLAAIMIHIGGYLIAAVSLSKFYMRFSLFGNSLLMYHNINNYDDGKVFPTLSQSFLSYGILAAVVFICIVKAIHRYDFRITVGTKQ